MNLVFGILLDLVLIGILALSIKIGSKNGFAKTIVSFFGVFIALILAVVLANPLAKLTYSAVIEKPAESAITSVLEKEVENISNSIADKEAIGAKIEEEINKLPAIIRNSIGFDKYSEEFHNLVNPENFHAEEISHNICNTYLKPAAISVLTVILFVILFIILALVLKLVSKSLKLVNKIPLIGKLNSFLGAVAGLLTGALVVLIVNWAIIVIVGDNSSLFKVITPEVLNASLLSKNLGAVNPLNALLDTIVHPN